MLAALVFVVSLTRNALGGLDFLAMGDWGGKEVWPYFTEYEKDTAAGFILNYLHIVFVDGNNLK